MPTMLNRIGQHSHTIYIYNTPPWMLRFILTRTCVSSSCIFRQPIDIRLVKNLAGENPLGQKLWLKDKRVRFGCLERGKKPYIVCLIKTLFKENQWDKNSNEGQKSAQWFISIQLDTPPDFDNS